MPMPNREPPEIQAIVDWLVAREPGVEAASAHAFLTEILAWNDALGLVSRRDTPGVLARLVRRSVALWRAVGEGAGAPVRVVDLGTGGGFPGVVWKLVAPGVHLLLIERSERKVAFLERVTARLRLDGVEVFAGDAREAARLPRNQAAYDGAVAMAVGRPADVGPVVAPLVRAGGWYATVGPGDRVPPERLGGAWRLRRTWRLDEATIILYARGDL
jgi:16S rRNA (guanine527-N7)-methyltransferase